VLHLVGREAPHVTDAEIAEYLPQIPEWELIEKDGIKRLQRVYRFHDFAEALAFTVRVGELAESESPPLRS
jgi:4a-hydroxytetrahydrobiopterin dehydratase